MAAINAPDFPGADDGGKFHDVVITAMADSTDDHGEGEGEEKLQTLMGLSLLLGFIFMLFVDQVGGGHSHTPSSGIAHTQSKCVGDFSSLFMGEQEVMWRWEVEQDIGDTISLPLLD